MDALGSSASNGSPSAKKGAFSRFRRQRNKNDTKESRSREVDFGANVATADSEVALDGRAGLSEKLRAEIVAMWGERDQLNVEDEALRVLLAQIFAVCRRQDHIFLLNRKLDRMIDIPTQNPTYMIRASPCVLYPQEDEESFIVSPALLEQLGAVGNEISLGDLLAGMDRIANADVGSSEELNVLVRTTTHSAAQRQNQLELQITAT